MSPVYVPPSATTPGKSQGGVHFRQFINDSVGSTSKVTTPAAATTVTWIFPPISGTYSVQAIYGYASTAGAAGTPNNIRLQVGNVTITSLVMVALANTLQQVTLILTVTTDQSIGLNVINADAGEVIGTLLATQIG